MTKAKMHDAYMVVEEWYGYDNEYYVCENIEDAKNQFRLLFRKGRTKKDNYGYDVEECIKQNIAFLDGRSIYINKSHCKIIKG